MQFLADMFVGGIFQILVVCVGRSESSSDDQGYAALLRGNEEFRQEMRELTGRAKPKAPKFSDCAPI